MKRKLNGKALALIALILLLGISAYKIPHFINVSKLEKLGYSENAIKAIYKKNIKSIILNNNIYSDYLNEEVCKDSFKKEYLSLYSVCDNLTDQSFKLYDRLKELKGYSDEELLTLFGTLEEYELTPLLVYDRVIVDTYIIDCRSHNNTRDSFVVENNYIKEEPKEVTNPEDTNVFVSRRFTIGEYVPSKLVAVPSKETVDSCYLETRALEAFNNLFTAMDEKGLTVYASGGYLPYEYAVHPGTYDKQTGLGVSLVSKENLSESYFNESKAYSFLKENAHLYGFIQRYPQNKESITLYPGEANYYRYVGVELATKIYNSGLTFDEYYMLYLY